MDAFDLLVTQSSTVDAVDPDRVLRDDGRIARELLDVLRAQRAQFGPRSSHPVAMMLDEWIARLAEHAARPLLPLPD